MICTTPPFESSTSKRARATHVSFYDKIIFLNLISIFTEFLPGYINLFHTYDASANVVMRCYSEIMIKHIFQNNMSSDFSNSRNTIT
jgi:hypothetical protein